MVGSGPFGEASGSPVPVVGGDVPRAAGTADQRPRSPSPADPGARINLLNWDGKGRPDGLFPPQPTDGGGEDRVTRDRDHGRRAAGRLGVPAATPTRAPARAAPPTVRRRGRRAAARPSPANGSTRFLDTADATDARAGGAALRRDVRHPAPLLPVPDLVDRRRDPPPRQPRSPRSRHATAHAGARVRRPRSCPTSCPPSSSSPPPSTCPAARAAAGAPRRAWSCCALALRRRGHALRRARRGGLRAAARPVARPTSPRRKALARTGPPARAGRARPRPVRHRDPKEHSR